MIEAVGIDPVVTYLSDAGRVSAAVFARGGTIGFDPWLGSRDLQAIGSHHGGPNRSAERGGKGFKILVYGQGRKATISVVSRETKKVHDHRVLAVDDNSTNRKILRHQLLAWKMQPVCANPGRGSATDDAR